MDIDFDDLSRSKAIFFFKNDTKARTRLWRRLGKQLTDGIPIVTAMEEMAALRKPGEAMGMALTEWSAVMKNGKKFSDAVRDWVTTEEVMLMMAGEQSGALPESMKSVVSVTKAKRGVQSAVVGGLAYPTFLMIIAFGVMFLFNFKIIPAFARAANGRSWSGMAKTMVDVSAFTQVWLPWIALLLVIAIGVVISSMPIWSGSGRTVADRYPPYSIYRVMQGSTFLIALSSLIQAGVRIDEALEQLADNSSPWARTRINAALRELRAGRNIGEALHRTGYEFPDREIISDIRVYATKSGFDEALRLIGEDWIEESVEQIKGLMNVVFSVSLLVVAGVIAFEVSGLIAMELQLSSFMQNVGR